MSGSPSPGHSRPAAMPISVKDLESLEETLFWQAQPGIHEDMEAGRREAATRQLHDEAAVRRRYGVGTTRRARGVFGGYPHLDQLPPRVVPTIIEFLYGALAENPHRVGKGLA